MCRRAHRPTRGSQSISPATPTARSLGPAGWCLYSVRSSEAGQAGWNSADSGSGDSIEVQGNNLFFVGFRYDGAGNPVRYYSAGADVLRHELFRGAATVRRRPAADRPLPRTRRADQRGLTGDYHHGSGRGDANDRGRECANQQSRD